MIERLEGALYRFYGYRVNGKKWLGILLVPVGLYLVLSGLLLLGGSR